MPRKYRRPHAHATVNESHIFLAAAHALLLLDSDLPIEG